MELKNYGAIYLGIICVLVFLIIYIVRRKIERRYKGGVRLADIRLVEQDAYYSQLKKVYRILVGVMVAALMLSIMAAGVLLARPYITTKVADDEYSRDIMICLDVSTSVDALNEHLVSELQDTVKSLKGERIGIVIFNTSPVLISPLTDDYEYIVEQLETIEIALKARIRLDKTGRISDDFYFLDEYISGGTLVGNEERGSSLIGDGLASCITDFNTTDAKRAKIVIFATDNEPNGDGLVSISEAAQLCKERNIIVYGVGTKEMTLVNMAEMRSAVEATGGKFYLEESSGTFDEIVKEIEAQSTSKIKGKFHIREVDQPKAAFLVLLLGLTVMCIVQKVLKK